MITEWRPPVLVVPLRTRDPNRPRSLVQIPASPKNRTKDGPLDGRKGMKIIKAF